MMNDVTSSDVTISSSPKASEKLLSTSGVDNNKYGTSDGHVGVSDDDDDRLSNGSDNEVSGNDVGCCPPSPTGSGNGKRSIGGFFQGCMDRFRSACCGCCSDSADDRCMFDCYWPRRYTVVLLQFIGMCITHAQRVNVGVAIISVLDAEHNVHSGATPSATAANDQLSQLHWTSGMIGWLHAIYYIGILISQIPCGYVLAKYQLPSNRLFGGCILLTHALNFLVPLSVTTSYVFVCVVRLLQGLVEGMLYPSCYDVMRHWTMPEERSRVGATVITGAYIGPTMGTIMSGILSAYAGWMYIFYYHGALGIVWYFLWLAFVYERPSKHPSISQDELKTIETKQGEAALIYEHDSVPWKAIFTSLPVYALIFCNFARSFVFYMMLTNGPAFLNVFHFTHVENGLFLALPYAFMAVFSLGSGLVADMMISKRGTTTTHVRKLFTCIGFGLSAVFFFCLAIVNDRMRAVVMMSLAVGLGGIAIAGWQINHLDLAPRYASVLVAITMTVGTLAGAVNPIMVAAITKNQELYEWHLVFWVTGLLLTFSLVFYGVFGSGERQPWAVPSPPTVRIVTRTDPLQGCPYGTFSAQVKYDPASSSVNFAMGPDVSEAPPAYQESVWSRDKTVGDTAEANATDSEKAREIETPVDSNNDIVGRSEVDDELKQRRLSTTTS